MSEFKKLTDDLSVSVQLNVDDVAAAKAAGFRTIVNNRPDGESADQPDSSEIEAAATAAGLTYIYQPVVSGQISDRNIEDFGHTLASAEGPVLAFCRTGTRCTCLWALSQAPQRELDDIARRAASAGYDLSGMMSRLQQRKG